MFSWFNTFQIMRYIKQFKATICTKQHETDGTWTCYRPSKIHYMYIYDVSVRQQLRKKLGLLDQILSSKLWNLSLEYNTGTPEVSNNKFSVAIVCIFPWVWQRKLKGVRLRYLCRSLISVLLFLKLKFRYCT